MISRTAVEAPDSLPAHGLDLDATLTSGQSFSWRRAPHGRWRGWIEGRPCQVWIERDALRMEAAGLSRAALRRYFNLDRRIEPILASFPTDPWLQSAQAFAPGLRILRQEPWETLCNFICSSLKQIVQIEQINHDLRRAFGEPLGRDLHTFPTPAKLALVSEADLRACRLGFRARHLFVAARQIASGEISLAAIEDLPTPEAEKELLRVRGVGIKVANCILLFAYGRVEAFPIDVWVERVLKRLYFNNRAKVSHERMRRFAFRHFGPYRGYAQQFLFHWIRKDPTALPAPRVKAKRKKAD